MNDDNTEINQLSFAHVDEKLRLKVIKNLDVKTYLEELEKIPNKKFMPNEDQALMILHKARYFLARQGHLDKKYMKDSRTWLRMNGIKLPNI